MYYNSAWMTLSSERSGKIVFKRAKHLSSSIWSQWEVLATGHQRKKWLLTAARTT